MKKIAFMVLVLVMSAIFGIIFAGCADEPSTNFPATSETYTTEILYTATDSISENEIEEITITVPEIAETSGEISTATIETVEEPATANINIYNENKVLVSYDKMEQFGKTPEEIYDVYINNDYSPPESGNSDEDKLRELLDMNVLCFYTIIEKTTNIAMYNSYYEEFDDEYKETVYKLSHIKSGESFDEFRDFLLDVYTPETSNSLLNIRSYGSKRPFFFEKKGELYGDNTFEAIYNIPPFLTGYKFDIVEKTETEMMFKLYFYKIYDFGIVELICKESKAVKVDGEWRLTELLY